jgi:hypothetical protein
MTLPFIETTETSEGWQSTFAFQVFHQTPEDWSKMRWGFNAAVLLDEALDRHKLFIESQTINETVYFDNTQPMRTLVLRGIFLPGIGLQMAILGKVSIAEKLLVEQGGIDFARNIYSTFPYDFILEPAKTITELNKLAGNDLLLRSAQARSIQRESAFIPPMRGFHYLNGYWNASARSNEQIWRALAGASQTILFNVMIQPTILLEEEKELLIEIKKKVLESEEKPEIFAPYYPWVEDYVKRRLAPWKKFFLMQIHVVAESNADESLVRSIGNAITRDTGDSSLPGFQVQQPNSAGEHTEWLEDLRNLTIVTPQRRVDDIADIEEVASVFRLPLRHETGLPGVNFIEPQA